MLPAKAVIASLPIVSEAEALEGNLTIVNQKPRPKRVSSKFGEGSHQLYVNRSYALDEAQLAADHVYLFGASILRVGSDGQVAACYYATSELARQAWAQMLRVSSELEQEERETAIACGYHSSVFGMAR